MIEHEDDILNDDSSQNIINSTRVGITHGDVNGIGYEVIIKTLADIRVMDFFTPVVYGSSKVASYHRKTLSASDFTFNIIKSADQAKDNKPNLVNVYHQEIKIDLGESTEIAGQVAYMALESAIEDLKKGHLEALVTAPINKQNIQSADFKFPGHTEYLAKKFGVNEPLMLMVSNNVRIGVITGHVALKDVPNIITEELILRKIRVLNQSLKQDFGIQRPKIAVLGLNPHAGDKGILGMEEINIITPAINKAFDEGILAFGPYPADGFFGSSTFKEFEGILAMYHDQGLIPFKTLAFKSGVNFTAGLPVVRTSPAHGTAYEIAGKNMASPDAFRESVYLALDIVKNRKIYEEINSNPLKASSKFDGDDDSDKLDLNLLSEADDSKL
ncbi:MAG: 4-hydroxythreonine-4-phosphate dehydrogenase PdxA [Bacteroidetes bacterium]|nr:4-hydroxythreonine-4-phosphate dehydrogenase PdxA [Bacteroidota bacterium]